MVIRQLQKVTLLLLVLVIHIMGKQKFQAPTATNLQLYFYTSSHNTLQLEGKIYWTLGCLKKLAAPAVDFS